LAFKVSARLAKEDYYLRKRKKETATKKEKMEQDAQPEAEVASP
jgi:hypothetical protein